MKRAFVPVLIFGGIILVVLIGAYVLHSYALPASPVSFSTYRNTKLGFQIEYPAGLAVRENAQQVVLSGDDGAGPWEIDITVSTSTQDADGLLRPYEAADIFERKFSVDGVEAYEYAVPADMVRNGPIDSFVVLVPDRSVVFTVHVRNNSFAGRILDSFHLLAP